ncbi:hypothetical protein [Nonomuraea typhae]|uniref:hypothetical protein n=1 Tax=Nonomuraea typhae TaxID=2603600 RepID=UPI0012FAC2AE|nr:hypothetical protein [Nonomuraea typhae]
MAIAIHGSTPAIVAGASSTQTTAAFNPPASSVLVACMAFEASGANGATLTLGNTGTSLTWTLRSRRDGSEGGAEDGIVAIYTAVNVAAQTGIDVSVTSSREDDAGALKVFVVTGADVTGPVGAVGEGSSTTDNITPNVYTSTAANSRAFGIGQDWNIQGAPTSSDTGFPWDVDERTSGIAVHKAADTATAGSTVTLNFNSAGAAPAWNWVAVEIKPAVEFMPRLPVVIGQAIQRASVY